MCANNIFCSFMPHIFYFPLALESKSDTSSKVIDIPIIQPVWSYIMHSGTKDVVEEMAGGWCYVGISCVWVWCVGVSVWV